MDYLVTYYYGVGNMRHKVAGRKLSRKKAPRELMLRNLVTSLVLYENIKTTEAKAKEARTLAEKLVTKAKKKDLAAIKYLNKYLLDVNAIKKINEVLVPRYEKRTSGYTRILRLTRRAGDGAKMVQLEFIGESNG